MIAIKIILVIINSIILGLETSLRGASGRVKVLVSIPRSLCGQDTLNSLVERDAEIDLNCNSF